MAAWFADGEALPRTPLNATLLLLSLMVLVSMWATYDLAISLPKISGMVLALGIFFAVARESRHPRGWWLGLFLFLGMGLAVATLGLLGTPWTAKFSFLSPLASRLSPRLTGVPGAEEGFNPNYVAGALLWVIPTFMLLSAQLVLKVRNSSSRSGYGRALVFSLPVVAGSLFVIGVLLLSQSRGGYLALALCSLLLIALELPPRMRSLFTATLIIGLGLLVWRDWRNGSGSIMQTLLGGVLAPTADSTVTSAQERLEVWSRAIYGIQDFPLTGMGMNTFRYVVQVLYPIFSFPPDIDIGHAHNEFLQAALDLGLFGLVAFIALYLGAFGMLWRIWFGSRVDTVASKSDTQPVKLDSLTGQIPWALEISPIAFPRLARLLALALGGGLLAHLIWGLTDAMALGARPAFLFWFLLGLVSGLHQQAEDMRLANANVGHSTPT